MRCDANHVMLFRERGATGAEMAGRMSHEVLRAFETKSKAVLGGFDADGDGKITGRELLSALDSDGDGTVRGRVHSCDGVLWCSCGAAGAGVLK